MPCNRCLVTFNVFRKEHGCSKCGFAFCAKCLSHKATIPALSPKPLPVCPKCYDEMTKQPVRHQPPPVSKASPSALTPQEDIHPDQRWWPPEDLPPPSMRHQHAAASSSSHSFKGPVVPQDKNYLVEYSDPMTADIAGRLQKLKDARQAELQATTPSQADIETRLANLRGVDVSEIRNPGKMFEQSKPPPKQTSHDLIAQAKDEAALDKKWDPADDVARRLAHLRGEEYNPSNSTRGDGEDDVDPSAYLNTSGVSANDGDRSRESEDAVLRNAAEVDELVKRAQRETEGDAKAALAGIQNDEEVQKALANIRQQTRQESIKDDEIGRELATARWNRDDVSDDGSDKELKEMAERIIKEAELEDAAEEEEGDRQKRKKQKKERPSTPTVDDSDDDDDEDSWCVICALDSTIQCRDCNQDLYCKRCFVETHDTAELRKHRTKPFKPYSHHQY